jgi:bacterioferritin
VIQNAEEAVPSTRDVLIQSLNEDLAREYQAIIASVVYSQVLKGAEFMNIAQELEKLAAQELQHALIIAKQVDHLGGTPIVQPKPVQVTDDKKALLPADLRNESDTIRDYRDRSRQYEESAELIREIPV